MASASEKAQYHLEKTVPELRDWERRELFTKAELSSVSSQRSHYETILNSRDASPALCLRYFSHERNLNSLLSKRLDRKHIGGRVAQKLKTQRQQQLFSILERSTRRFHGDLRLWSQYLDFCKEQGSAKRVQRVVADVCRLFPTRGAVWEWAADWAEQRGDMQQARSFWLRGCRFCPKDWRLRVSFARAEMRWVVRARKTLGVKDDASKTPEQARIAAEVEDQDANIIALPAEAEAEDMAVRLAGDQDAGAGFEHFSSTPAMTGAIPMAIFDSAMTATGFNDDAIDAFFAMFAEFPRVQCTNRILQHILDVLEQDRPSSPAYKSCQCRMPLVGAVVDSPDFPSALRQTLKLVKDSLASLTDATQAHMLSARLLSWTEPLSKDERLVPELQQVLGATVRRLSKHRGSE